MVDSFTESTPTGFLQEVGDSIKGVLVGAVLLLICSCCLFGNEWRYVQRKKALEGGLAQTQEVSDNSKVDASLEGKLVLVNGTAKTDAKLSDETFGVEVGAMKLVRTVEMYQYQEESKTSGKRGNKTTTYSYPMKWSEKAIDSTKFNNKRKPHIKNPGSMPYEGNRWTADSATLGAYKLTSGQIGGMSASQKIDPKTLGGGSGGGGETGGAKTGDGGGDAKVDPLTCQVCKKKVKSEAGLKDHMKAKGCDKKLAEMKKNEGQPASVGGGDGGGGGGAIPAGYKIHESYLFKGTPQDPQVGDVRISWSFAPPEVDVTVVGKQTGDTFASYEINGSDVSGLHMGIQDKKTYFAQEQAANTMMLYVIRIFGTILMIVGFGMIFAPLSAVTDIIPLVGDVVDMGTGCAAAGLGLVVSFLMIALGWVFSRPLVGIPLLLLGIGGFVGLIILAKSMGGKKKAAAPAGAPVADGVAPPPAPPAPPAPEAPAS